MDAIDLLLDLQSVRDFESKDIPHEVLDKMLGALQIAPSASNIQPWHFVVVTDNEVRNELAKGYANFIGDAAVTIVGCGEPAASPDWYKIEVAIGMQQIVLAAWLQGVGSCWVDFSGREKKIRSILHIPDNLEPIAMAAFGYPAKVPEKRPWKKPLEDIIHYNGF